MMNRTLLVLCLAVALVALPACDDGGDLASTSGDEAHRTVFSNKSITGSHLQVDGTVETTGDMEGRVRLDVAGAVDKSGASRASTPALQSVPSSIEFSGTKMTYTTRNGKTRMVNLSEGDARMLRDAMQARKETRAPLVGEEGTAPGRQPQRLTEAQIADLEKRGLTVNKLGNQRYEIVQPSSNGGVAIRSIYDAKTGRLTGATAEMGERPVVRIAPSEAKDGSAPTVDRLE